MSQPTEAALARECLGNAFGYLEHQETEQFLCDLAGLLTPGGSLILDYGFVAESLLPHLTWKRSRATEVTRMVVASEFTDVERFGDVDGAPFELGNPRFFLVARRA